MPNDMNLPVISLRREKLGGVPNLGQVLGIRLRFHYTWSVAFALITAAVVTQFPESYPIWYRIILGIVASLTFLVAVGVREVALGALAIRRGIRVKRVTLFVFGGTSQLTEENASPIIELLTAAAGLLTTLVIAGVFYMVNLVLLKTGSFLAAGLTQWLYFIIFMLFQLHLLPCFPLDGGKILRALIWRATSNYERATRIASWAGWGISLLFIIGGILELTITREWFVGPLLLLMGWVLLSAAVQSHRQAAMRAALQGTTAQQIMTREYSIISQQLSLSQLVQDYVLVTGQYYFVVADDVKLQGIVTMNNIKQIPKKRWRSTTIDKIMTPASKLKTAHPRQSAASLLEQMDELDTSQMPVVEKGNLMGIVSRNSLLRLVKTRARLKM